MNKIKETLDKKPSRIAKQVELITFPKGVTGTNCGNCQYGDGDYCKLLDIVLADGAKNMCCDKWMQPGTKTEYTDEELTRSLIKKKK